MHLKWQNKFRFEHILRPSKFINPDVSLMAYCDHGYGRPSGRPRVSNPATYRSGTPRIRHPAVAQWHRHLRGLVTAIHETSGLWAHPFLEY